MPLRIGSVVVDSKEPTALAEFWAEALGYKHIRWDAGWSRIVDPEGRRAGLSFGKEKSPKTESNRLHFDLYTSAMESEVERLTGLGARVKRRVDDPGNVFVVMQDPEGNEFCVCQKDDP